MIQDFSSSSLIAWLLATKTYKIPSMNDPIYLDYAAATPVGPDVLDAMWPYFSERFYNPSATYLASQAVRKDLEIARGRVAQTLGARPVDITFTAGGTEANNLAIRGVMAQYPGGNIVVSAVEHESVLAVATEYNYKIAPVNEQGMIDLLALENLIDENTVLVSVMYANNEVGTIQPIRKIAEIIEKKRSVRANSQPLYLHTDACQAALYLDLHISRLGVDMMTLNGGKIYGPKQSGVLYAHSGVSLKPQVVGGGQERGRRSGTENVAFAVGMSLALEKAQATRHEETKRLQHLQNQFFDEIVRRFPAAIINGSRKNRLPNNVHVTFPGVDNERLLMQLDESGVQAAAGSACSASNEEPSHVLAAMHIRDELAQNSLRFTMGRTTTDAAIAYTLETLARLLS